MTMEINMIIRIHDAISLPYGIYLLSASILGVSHIALPTTCFPAF